MAYIYLKQLKEILPGILDQWIDKDDESWEWIFQEIEHKCHVGKKGQEAMSELKELRDYLLENVRWDITIEIEYDKLKIRDSKQIVCYISKAYGEGFNIQYLYPYNFDNWEPVICEVSERIVCSSINDRIKKYNQDHASSVAKYMNNRINVNVDNDTVTKQICMMSARGNGKTRFVSDLLKNKTVVYNGNIYTNIENVIFNDPATIVFWTDGSKTVVKCQKGETFDPEKGLAMAISKKVLGNDYSYYETFAKHVGRYNKKRGKKNGADRKTT